MIVLGLVGVGGCSLGEGPKVSDRALARTAPPDPPSRAEPVVESPSEAEPAQAEPAQAEGAPPMKEARPRHQGGLSKETIRRGIREQTGPRLRCGEEAMQRVDAVPGATADFTIGADGKVTDGLLRDPCSDDPEFLRCLHGVVMSMTFPRPEGGGLVNVKSYDFGVTTAEGCSIGCEPVSQERYPPGG